MEKKKKKERGFTSFNSLLGDQTVPLGQDIDQDKALYSFFSYYKVYPGCMNIVGFILVNLQLKWSGFYGTCLGASDASVIW